MKRRNEEECSEISKTKLVHCNRKRNARCKCQPKHFEANDDLGEQTVSLCPLGHNEIKNAFLSLDFVAKRMENRENYNKVSWPEKC